MSAIGIELKMEGKVFLTIYVGKSQKKETSKIEYDHFNRERIDFVVILAKSMVWWSF